MAPSIRHALKSKKLAQEYRAKRDQKAAELTDETQSAASTSAEDSRSYAARQEQAKGDRAGIKVRSPPSAIQCRADSLFEASLVGIESRHLKPEATQCGRYRQDLDGVSHQSSHTRLFLLISLLASFDIHLNDHSRDGEPILRPTAPS